MALAVYLHHGISVCYCYYLLANTMVVSSTSTQSQSPPPFCSYLWRQFTLYLGCVMLQPNPKNSRPKWCSWLTNEVMLLCGLYEVKNIKENYIEIVDFNEFWAIQKFKNFNSWTKYGLVPFQNFFATSYQCWATFSDVFGYFWINASIFWIIKITSVYSFIIKNIFVSFSYS